VSVVASGTARAHLPSPPAAFLIPPAPDRQVIQTSASAPVEWILLFLGILAVGFAVWLWSSWGRPRPPTAPA
jgi:hypothetical protein